MIGPLVSVIIPAYNSERHIAESIESVLSQSYRHIEPIVVDDGSTDKTKDIVCQYREVTYIYQENGGPSRARNTGIRQAKGNYITFLDSDDLWPTGKLEKQVNMMEEHPEIALIFGDVSRFAGRKILMSSMFVKDGLSKEFFGDSFHVRDAYKKLFLINYIPTGSVILRKECLSKAGLFDESFRLVEDLDLWFRIAIYYPIGYSTDIWELKRDHSCNVSNNIEEMGVSLIKVLKKQETEFQDYLMKHRIDLGLHLHEIYRNLGYLYLTSSRLTEARKYFRESLFRKIQIRTLIYWFATFLGATSVETIQRLRSKL